MTGKFTTWKIQPNEHGWWLYTEGDPEGLWWHVYFDISVGNVVFPTLEDVFAKIKEKNT